MEKNSNAIVNPSVSAETVPAAGISVPLPTNSDGHMSQEEWEEFQQDLHLEGIHDDE